MKSLGSREADLADVADRRGVDATAIPPDDLPDNPQAYLAWLRDPEHPVRRPKPRRALHAVPEPAPVYAHHETRDPAYQPAAEKLRRLPDLGVASLEAARAALGDVELERLVIHAAANPVMAPADDGNAWRRNGPAPYAAMPGCSGCGTALDPDGTCLTCTTTLPAPTPTE